ncbi:hypothetical protein H9L21_14700 [Aeromicrobium senzhongii]|uniref:Polysaccharide biosynthesis protein n=1 Tax=Aeromicrobium senzhongii TaxID=2663859 RepID=A0ABX6ST39_9ACTN|nr:hypothetical protein [Aeromicrobium senzhongii]MTB89565.1 hypothetical protein [Aeromicrobium senzhongii]QNL94307.1 hypothetical protein H9L21_14700 [Aeromicrobium senzhongii]
MLRKVAGFGLVPFLALAAPFFLLPIIALRADAGEWTAIALGQSAGAFAGTVVTYGWNLSGPVQLSGSNGERQRALWWEFLASSFLLWIGCAVLQAAALLLVLGGQDFVLGYAVALSLSAVGLTPAWFAVGVGRPSILLFWSAAPRLVSIVLAAFAILATHQLMWYPALLLGATLLGVLGFSVKTFRGHTRPAVPRGDVRARFAANGSVAASTIVSSSYSAGFLFFVGLAAPGALSVGLASCDRLFRFANQAVSTLSNALQAWVLEHDGPRGVRRRRSSVVAHIALGITGFLGFALLGPSVTSLLFGEDFASTYVVSIFFGLAFLAVSVSSVVIKHLMVPARLTRQILLATLVGAIAGIAMILSVARTSEDAGAAFSYLVAEGMVALVLSIAYARHVRRMA